MWADRIYGLLPQRFQDLAVSARGWQFHRQRYQSGFFRNAERTVKSNEHCSVDFLRDMQFQTLRVFAGHCAEHSPYFGALWKSKGFSPDDLRTMDDLTLLPIVSKQELRGHTEQFFTRDIKREDVQVHTSGTTGSPMTVYFTPEDVAWRAAFLERCRRWAGVHIGQRRVSFTGRDIIPARQTKPPFWRFNRPGNQLLLSAYHLSPENLPAYVAALANFDPEIVDGYPSAIHILADHLLRRGDVGLIQPDALLVSAETVLPRQRATIETAFQAKLFNQYGSSEGAPLVSECRFGRLHVFVDSGVIEILNGDGTATAAGHFGEMVVTSFTTHLTPLVRYAIGDMAVPTRDSLECPCGAPFPALQALAGRMDDILYTEERGFVGRMDTAFKDLPNTIVEAQITQMELNSFRLLVVPDGAEYKREHGNHLVADMHKKLGAAAKIELEEVNTIPRSANGKMRPVVNLCRHLLPKEMQCAESYGDLLQLRPDDLLASCGVPTGARPIMRKSADPSD
jgi:phenylacetate-CoA ligase